MFGKKGLEERLHGRACPGALTATVGNHLTPPVGEYHRRAAPEPVTVWRSFLQKRECKAVLLAVERQLSLAVAPTADRGYGGKAMLAELLMECFQKGQTAPTGPSSLHVSSPAAVGVAKMKMHSRGYLRYKRELLTVF